MKGDKFVEITSIMQVLGCLYNKPSIFENENYKFKIDDFYDEFHKIVYISIYNLWQLGAKEINVPSILDYLSQRPKAEAVFKTNKGEEFLLKIAEYSNINTFNYYYNRMKKMTLLRAYAKLGIDLSKVYDPDNIFDSKKKQEQEEWLDNSSLIDIYDKIHEDIDIIKEECIEEIEDNGVQISEGIDELIDSFAETPALGYPLFGDYINTVTRGARLGKFFLTSASTGTGKAIPNNTLIPTPNGWRKVGDIKEGDYLFGQDGKPTKVVKVHPQPNKKDIWKVTFSDGREAQCCSEHLWEYRYDSHRGKAYRVENTQQIYERAMSLNNNFKNSSNKGYRFHIKLNEPIEYEAKKYSVPPYVMGALLGDGSFRYDKNNKALSFSSKDDKIPSKIASLLNCTYHKNSELNYSYTFKPLNNIKHNIWVEELLKDYPDLWQAKSETKFIPSDYLQGSIEQRYELLQGLLDTDGTINIKGRVRFTTVSPKLRDNIIELTRSLGMIANYSIDKRHDKYTTGECYSVSIQSKKELKPKLFTLDYKVEIATTYANSNKRCEYKDHLAIVNIEKTKEITDMTCFTVDNDSHLFLMNDFIVTHNTRSMISHCCYIGCDSMYDINSKQWVSIGESQSALYIATEQDKSECQTMCLAFLAGVDEEHILRNSYFDGEIERVRHAAEVLKRSKIYFECLPDFTLQSIENTIKKNIRENNTNYIFMDYIHSSASLLLEVGGSKGVKNLREDNVLFLMSSKLKDLAVQYGVFILSSTQLNAAYQTSETPDQNLLRGKK